MRSHDGHAVFPVSDSASSLSTPSFRKPFSSIRRPQCGRAPRSAWAWCAAGGGRQGRRRQIRRPAARVPLSGRTMAVASKFLLKVVWPAGNGQHMKWRFQKTALTAATGCRSCSCCCWRCYDTPSPEGPGVDQMWERNFSIYIASV